MAVEIARAYLINGLSDFCRVTEHLASPTARGRRRGGAEGWGPKGSSGVKRSKKGGLSGKEGRAARPRLSPRDESFKRTRGGED